MAKSKANKAKKAKNKNASKPKNTVDAVEAKLTEKELAAEEAEVVDEKELDEEVVEEEVKKVDEVEDEEIEDDEDLDEDVEEDDEDSDEEDEVVEKKSKKEEEDEDSDEEDEDDSDDEDEDLDEDLDEDEDEDDEEDEVVEKKSKKNNKKAQKETKKSKKDKKADKKAAKEAKAKKDAEDVEEKKNIAAEVEKVAIVTPAAAKPKFFARKFDASENILTIFKTKKIYAAIIAELLGTGIITMIALTLGLFNPLYMILAYVGLTLAVFKLSGANFNPIITAGMLASRRMSAIRGVLYILAQAIGAWLGFMIVNAFFNAGVATGNVNASQASLPALMPINDIKVAADGASYFWPIAMIEFVGATIIAFAYARALQYKKNDLTFAWIIGGGIFIALALAALISGSYLGLNGYTFVLNPATALVYGVLPASAAGFDALMQALMPMLVAYVIVPVVGGIVGFFVSDIASRFAEEDVEM